MAIIPRSQDEWRRVFGGAVCASVVLSFVSIAAYQILLGVSLAVLLSGRVGIVTPPPWPAAAAFFALTLASLAASPDPGAGLPQIRKFYVWLALITVATAIRELKHARLLLLAAAGTAALSSVWSLLQFGMKYQRAQAAGHSFYLAYVADRITGFMSHWMTFSGQMMVALIVICAWLLFGEARKRTAWLAAALVIGVALVLSFSRGNWAAAGAGLTILVWHWRKWAVLALPVLLAGVVLVAPAPLYERIQSIWNPSRQDSNTHRVALREAGIAMIAAHPMLGVGPEQVKERFPEFVPERYKPIPADWWYNHLHNVYIHYAAERGVPALIALLLFAAWALRDYWRAWRRLSPGRGDRRFLLAASIACIAAILIGGLWEVNLGDSEVLMLFVSLVSVGYVAARA